jgi:hypothetical protein
MRLTQFGGLGALLIAGAALGQPANNNCPNATPVADGMHSGTTVGATNDGAGLCGNSGASPDVWFEYIPVVTGQMTVSLCGGAGYDSVVGIWSECPGAGGSELSCNDDSCNLQSQVQLSVQALEDYFIRVSGFGGATGAFTFTVQTVEPSPPGEGGPDVTYLRTHAITHWGEVGDVHGYSLGSRTCNLGDENLDWGPSQIGGTTPLLAMNAYRLSDGRLEQIGMSWVKNGTTAATGSGCGLACNGVGGTWLGAGCEDVYGSSYNGTQDILGRRSLVNPLTGTYPGATGGTGDAIYKRLQIKEPDLSAPGALYFVEGHYVAWDDALAGNAMNNASYKRVTVNGSFDLTPADTLANVQTAAIYAWRDHGNGVGQPDPSVQVVEADVPEEGRFLVASKATDLGAGLWRYDYGVYNFNSDRAGGSFTVPLPAGVAAAGLGFHDVDYHSGEPYSNADWGASLGPGAGSVTWTSPETFAANPNTNALRWGTLYNFWFVAGSAPVKGEVTIGLFKPGTPAEIAAAASVPGPTKAPPCPADTNGDGAVNVLDLTAVLLNWGCDSCPDQDVNGDGVIDVGDLVDLILAWGDCP